MDFMGQLGGLLNQYASGGATDRQQARNDFDQVAGAVPKDLLGSMIGPALNSLSGDQVQERVRNAASEMTPQERGGLLGNLLGGLGSSGIDLGSLLGRLGVNPEVARNPEQASPEDVARVAAHAKETDPTLFERAMSFFAENPALVKVLGTAVITLVMKNLFSKSSGGAQSNSGDEGLGGLLGKLGI